VARLLPGCQHVLSKGFVRIRHYGLLSTAIRSELLELQQAFGVYVPLAKEKKDWKRICREHHKYDPESCPCCGKGKMITIGMQLAGLSPSYLFTNEIRNLSENAIK
jgi:hypothetical protein